MKLIRRGSMLLVLVLALGFSLGVPYSSAQEEDGGDGGDGGPPKCDCKYPNPPEEYGVRNSTTCVVTDCWIALS